MLDTTLEAALFYSENGFSVIPIRTDGSKGPLIMWKKNMETKASADQIKTWSRSYGALGIGVVGGKVSGNAEIIDFDDKDTYHAWRKQHSTTLSEKLCVVQTPDGFHVWFRCSQAIEGNQLLAARVVDGKRKILAETRGEGGYAIVPGSAAGVHPTRIPYKLIQGSFDALPVISKDQRNELMRSVKSFDEAKADTTIPNPQSRKANSTIDSFNEGEDWANILGKKGWRMLSSQSDGQSLWQKPGSSNSGHHVSVNYEGSDKLYCFSDACAFRQETHYTKFEAYTLLCHQGNAKDALSALAEAGWGDDDDSIEAGAGKSQTAQLAEIVKQCELWHSPDGKAFATIETKGILENHAITSRIFQDWLVGQCYKRFGFIPADETIHRTQRLVEYQAREKAEHKPCLRMGLHEDIVYYSLGDSDGNVVRITKDGWSVVSSSPIKFIRKPTTRALPKPQCGGNINEFLDLFHLQDQDIRQLVVAWLLGSIKPNGPYPILCVSGEQGSAKSTFTAALRQILDPADPMVRAQPRDERDLAIHASNSRIVAFDNLSGMPVWLSDALCRFSTGTGWATRALYSDDDELVLKIKVPIILNAIDDLAWRGDFADRAIIIHLDRIPKSDRLTEDEFWKRFESLLPGCLGYLFDLTVAALRRYETYNLPEKPRMADFAKWVASAEEAAGWTPGSFIRAYAENAQQTTETVLDASLLASSIEKMLDLKQFVGTPTDLFRELCAFEPRLTSEIKSSSNLGSKLRRLAPALRSRNISVEFGKAKKRSIEIRFL